MARNIIKSFCILIMAIVLVSWVFELEAQARAGGGRSMGGRGSRGISPSRSYQSGPSKQQSTPAQQPAQQQVQQPAGGGFLRSMGGGILGGLLGGMLLGSLFGMSGGFGGSGIGLLEILLIVGGGFLLFRMFRKRNESSNYAYRQQGYSEGGADTNPQYNQPFQPADDGKERGFADIRRMDPSFDEPRFKDTAMDIFFKVQGAWMNRDLAPVKSLLTDEMTGNFQNDIGAMLRDKKVNRLENIAVRSVDVEEVWQESGQDFVTVRIYANLLDYTTDDTTGNVIEGSKTEPVKFEEYWTFTRGVGNNSWKLTAIEQQSRF